MEQVAACEVIVDKLQTRWSSTANRLGLHHRVAFLADYTHKYRVEISLHRNLTFATVQRFRTRGQNNLRMLVAIVLAEFVDIDDPAQVAARDRLLRPLNEQIDDMRTRARHRRISPGEDIETAAVVDGADADVDADTDTGADAVADANADADASADAVADANADAVADAAAARAITPAAGASWSRDRTAARGHTPPGAQQKVGRTVAE